MTTSVTGIFSFIVTLFNEILPPQYLNLFPVMSYDKFRSHVSPNYQIIHQNYLLEKLLPCPLAMLIFSCALSADRIIVSSFLTSNHCSKQNIATLILTSRIFLWLCYVLNEASKSCITHSSRVDCFVCSLFLYRLYSLKGALWFLFKLSKNYLWKKYL